MLYSLAMALVPVFFVMFVGYGAGKLRVVEGSHVDALNAFVMQFALPAAMFAAIAACPRSELLRQGPLFCFLAAIMLVTYFGWYVLARHLRGAARPEASLEALTVAFPNLAGIGLPVAASLLGPTGAVPIAIALACGAVLINPMVLLALAQRTDASRGQPRRSLVARVLLRPVVIAPVAAAVVSLSGIGLEPIVTASLDLIGGASAGAALFLTGVVLASQPLRLGPTVIMATVAANIVRPAIAFGIIWLIPLDRDLERSAVLIAAIPSGFFGILFALDERQDSTTVGSIVLLSSIVGFATMAVAINLLP
jgi:malonate transporter